MIVESEMWLEALHGAAEELAATYEFGDFEIVEEQDAPLDAGGALIGLRAGDAFALVACTGSPEEQAKLVRAFSQMDDDEVFEDGDLEDGLREFANVFGGTIKAALEGEATGLSLSLPMASTAPVSIANDASVQSIRVQMGGSVVTLAVLDNQPVPDGMTMPAADR